MNKKVFYLIIFLLVTVVDARQLKKQSYGFNGKYPYDKDKLYIPPEVQEKRFLLNLDENTVKELQKKIKRKQDLLDGTLDVAYLQKPLFKNFKTVDTLYLHGNFITNIVFPKEFKISFAKASFKTKEFIYQNNILLVQPEVDAKNGNIVITMSNGKKNILITIFVKQYFKNDECRIVGDNYKCSMDYLSTYVKYIKQRILTTEEKFSVIEDYLKLHGTNKIKIDKNLSYLTLKKKDITYYIIRDDEFGEIYKNGVSLRVTTALK